MTFSTVDKKRQLPVRMYFVFEQSEKVSFTTLSDLRKATVTPNELSTERPMALYANGFRASGLRRSLPARSR